MIDASAPDPGPAELHNPRPLRRIRTLYCLLGVADGSLAPFVPLLLRARGLDPQALGAVLALMSATAFVASPGWGFLADRVLGYERALGAVLAAAVVAAVLLGLARGVIALAAAGSLLWAVRAPILATADAMALARLGDRRGAYGGIRLWMSIGFAAGALSTGVLVDTVGLGLLSPLYAALCAFNALAVGATVRSRRARQPGASPRSAEATGLRLTRLPAALLFLFALFLLYAAYNAAYNFGAVRIASLGGGATFVGLAAGLQAAAEVPSLGWSRRFGHRVHPGFLFIAGAVLYIVVYGIWAAVADPATLAALRLVSGVGFGLAAVATVLLVDDAVPVHLRATGQASAKAVASGLAPIAGSLGGGLVYGYLGASTFFIVAAAMTAAAALITYQRVVRPVVAGAREVAPPASPAPSAPEPFA